MLTGELRILHAIALNNDEASVAEICGRLGNDVGEGQIRNSLRRLSSKGNVVWQRSEKVYSLTYQGKARLLTGLAAFEPGSSVLKKEARKKKLVVSVRVEALDEGGFLATCPSIQGCHAEGNTVAEALENLEDVAQTLLDVRKQHGLPVPEDLEDFHPNQVLDAQLLVALPG